MVTAVWGFLALHGGEVSNLGLEGGSTSGDDRVGGLAGINLGSILNCHSIGGVIGNLIVGGLVGTNSGSISHCYSISDVVGRHLVGGLVGCNWESISNCYSTGDVNGVNSVGALVGESGGGSVSNCYSTGEVNGVEDVGGLVGKNGIGGPGGIVPGYIFDSYSTGTIQRGSSSGGLVGYNFYGDIERSFWDVETSDEPNMCGDQYDLGSGCDPNYGKTAAEMKQKSTFTDWDFTNVWNIGENQTYPYLRTTLPSDLNKDNLTNFLDLCIVAERWCNEE